MKTTGHYYRSRKEYEQRTGKSSKYIQNNPCIHISGSVRGMRKLFWGYKCDVVRVGSWIYKVNNPRLKSRACIGEPTI